MRLRAVAVLGALSAGCLVAEAQEPAAATESVRMGFRVFPDTVTVGQPFRLIVRALVPAGARIALPEGPDTAAVAGGIRPIELRRARSIAMTADTAVAIYDLVAWDVGSQPLRMPDVVVTGESVERRASLAGVAVFVRSVLPADTTLHVPKPARKQILLPAFNWWPYAAALAVLLLALLLWLLWRRLRNRPPISVDPYRRAQQAFARIERLEMIRHGRSAEYVEAVVDVARVYLAARVPGAQRSNTTSELLLAIRSQPSAASQLTPLLRSADLVKFARGRVSDEDAVRGGEAARTAVDSVESAYKAEMKEGSRERAA